MKHLTLEMLEAGQGLKAALARANRLFGLEDTKTMINAWLKVNDPGVSRIETVLTGDELEYARQITGEEVL